MKRIVPISIVIFSALIWVFTECNTNAREQLQTENVVLITLDGLRWQELFSGADPLLVNNGDFVRDTAGLYNAFWNDNPDERRRILMPFFWSTIAGEGQLIGNRNLGCKVNVTNQMWFSYPGYNEILTGFADDENIRSNDKIPNPNQTVLEFVNTQLEFTGRVAAFGSWDVFPYIINEERNGIPVNAGFEDAVFPDLSERELFLNELQLEIPREWATVRYDAFTHHYAVEYIKREKPGFIYIAYGETDDFAHDGRYDQYLWSAHNTDGLIKQLWELMQSMDTYRDKTTFIITTDHGRGVDPLESWKHHGEGSVERSDEIWITVLGPDTQPLGEISGEMQFFQNQVAATAANYLGFDFDNDGRAGKSLEVFTTVIP